MIYDGSPMGIAYHILPLEPDPTGIGARKAYDEILASFPHKPGPGKLVTLWMEPPVTPPNAQPAWHAVGPDGKRLNSDAPGRLEIALDGEGIYLHQSGDTRYLLGFVIECVGKHRGDLKIVEL